MKHLLALLTEHKGAAHRAVFHEFATRLERAMRRRTTMARVRVVRA